MSKIYLASKSPRRKELLNQIGVHCTVLSPEEWAVDETPHISELAIDYVQRITRHKAMAAGRYMAHQNIPQLPLLAADTTVTIDGHILGKPTTHTQARTMMQLLSGRTHQVLSSVMIWTPDRQWQATQISEVTFMELPDQLIESYCATSEPYDKAGGYGIQGHAARFIHHISGSYSGIMGLPLFETSQLLQQANCL